MSGDHHRNGIGKNFYLLLKWKGDREACQNNPRAPPPPSPSYDTHRQFDYGWLPFARLVCAVCVQHFGEHVSDDRRKRGREEGRKGSLGIVTRNTERGNISRMRPMRGKVPISPSLAGHTE